MIAVPASGRGLHAKSSEEPEGQPSQDSLKHTVSTPDQLTGVTQPTERRGLSSKEWIALFVCGGLAIQGTAFVMMRAYFHSAMCDSQVLLWGEAMKFVVSLVALGWREFRLLTEGVHLAVVPVVTYGVMNLLSFYALKRLPATLSIIIIQLKLVTTALWARILLGRPLLTARSFALTGLVFGCVSITLYQRELDAREDDAAIAAGSTSRHTTSMLALGALILETVLSGLISVYMQRIFAMSPQIMWRRNVQLALLSGFFYVGVSALDGPEMCDPSMYNPDGPGLVLGFISASGGLLAALSILYSGAVGKVVATSASIALTVFAEALFVTRALPSVMQSSLCATVLNAVVMYTAIS